MSKNESGRLYLYDEMGLYMSIGPADYEDQSLFNPDEALQELMDNAWLISRSGSDAEIRDEFDTSLYFISGRK